MVDLVKIRKKAKEKKKDAAAALLTESSPAEVVVTPQSSVLTPESSTPPPSSLDRLEAFKKLLGQKRESSVVRKRVAEPAPTAAPIELLTFDMAGEHYALAIDQVVEIVEPRVETRIPNVAAGVVGVISLRGTIVTILDVRRKLGHPAAERAPGARIIVVESNGETTGFLVDRVSRVVKIDPSKLESHPVVNPNEQREAIRGVFRLGETLTILLDLEKLIRF